MSEKVEKQVDHAQEQMTGADLLVDTLIEQNVDTIFGYPGGAVLPIYDALYRSEKEFDHILSRHEQGSIFAAEGYARVTGRPGVVISTSGPGATNLVTGIANAMLDSVPLVILMGQVSSGVIGTDAFQESDMLGITSPITKYGYQIRELEELPRIIKEAFHIATTGRPGPVVIDVPKDVTEQIVTDTYDTTFDLPGYKPMLNPNPSQIKKVVSALEQAEKPLILSGGGVITAQGSEELTTFAKKYDIPVVNSLLGLGSFPGTDALALGMGGMHGTYAANMAITECDLLLNIGTRFDDRLTGNLEAFAPNAVVVHVDIDPAEIGKNVPTDVPVVGDAKRVLEALLEADINMPGHDAWKEAMLENKKTYPLWYERSDDLLSPQWLIEQVYEVSKGDAIVATDVGQHQMWSAQYYTLDKPNRWVTSGGLGSMGFGIPSAIGAQLGRPEELVITLVGDGGFQMNSQELAVINERNIPIKIIIVNNEALGMVRQWQESFYDERYSQSQLTQNPDFVKLAESYGVRGVRVAKEADLVPVLEDVFAYDGPVVVDCRVVKLEKVYPMVAPGKGLDEMIGVTKS